jgi:hypothetical protein
LVYLVFISIYGIAMSPMSGISWDIMPSAPPKAPNETDETIETALQIQGTYQAPTNLAGHGMVFHQAWTVMVHRGVGTGTAGHSNSPQRVQHVIIFGR